LPGELKLKSGNGMSYVISDCVGENMGGGLHAVAAAPHPQGPLEHTRRVVGRHVLGDQRV